MPGRKLRRATVIAALLAAQLSGNSLAMAGEEPFRPIPQQTLPSATALNWRAKGSSRRMPVQQAGATASDSAPATSAVTPAAAAEPLSARPLSAGPLSAGPLSAGPATAKPAQAKTAASDAPAVLPTSAISSSKTRSRLRDSVMQVSTYQEQDPERPPFSDAPANPPAQSELRDPFDAQNPAPAPPDSGPPAMPMDDPLPLPDTDPDDPSSLPAAENTQPVPPDDLFRDKPIRTPRTPAELPPSERDQLLEGMSTDPGGPGCEDQKDECQKAIRELQKRDITTITVGLLIEGEEGTDYPCDCRLGRDFDAPAFAGRDFAPTLFAWKASGTCHKPLYFEDVQLERYGHSWNPVLQPFVSGAHFFVSVPLLPYKMGLRPPNECVYTLGYYRPGNCAPYMFEPIPLSLRAAVAQGFGTAAFAFWFWPPN